MHTGQVVHPKNPPPVRDLLYVIVLPHNGQLNVVVLGPSVVVLVIVLALAWGTVTATGIIATGLGDIGIVGAGGLGIAIGGSRPRHGLSGHGLAP